MCDYCEKGKSLELNRKEETNIAEFFIASSSDGAAIFIRQPKFEIVDMKVLIKQMTQYAYLDIHYCPICGRELMGN